LWQPAVKVCQKDSQLVVRAAVAGVGAKELSVTVTPEDLLIKAKFLWRPGHGMYTRLTDGDTARPRSRMVRAEIADDMARRKEAV
jgi:HSP20 family molecular chaperone IbpA